MPLGDFGSAPSAGASLQEMLDMFARLQKEVNYLLNGGLDTLNVNELSADVINAGVLNAALVTVKAALTGLAYIQLAASGMKINDGTRDTFVADTAGKVTMTGATIKNTLTGAAFTQIDDTGIKINDGTKDTFAADTAGKVTMTGATIRSSAGYPRVEMSPTGDVVKVYYDANTYITVLPNFLAGTPVIQFTNGTKNFQVGYFNGQGTFSITSDNAAEIQVGGNGKVRLNPVGDVVVKNFAGFVDGDSLKTLQASLNEKAAASAITGTVYVAATSGAAATTPITFTNGVRTT